MLMQHIVVRMWMALVVQLSKCLKLLPKNATACDAQCEGNEACKQVCDSTACKTVCSDKCDPANCDKAELQKVECPKQEL